MRYHQSVMSPALVCLGLVSMTGISGSSASAASETPQAFAQRIIAKLNAFATEKWHGNYEQFCAEFCEAGFQRLIAHANDKEAVLDYNPFCQCQDTGGVYEIQSTTALSSDEYQVRLREKKFHKTPWDIVLRAVNGSWRIYDVIESGQYGGGSLRRRLLNT